ncbi:hypothetical protein PR048_011288 [Dryococelus australis]|uniref:YqaJ viral recombinase domain-containing protein n=1 Tax=Dryococelus australis TaxID=614101 RepID=A0ABQ9HL70_9NEOP|nr:hypothetical protein PR048_011288 [Dryococelus australis]
MLLLDFGLSHNKGPHWHSPPLNKILFTGEPSKKKRCSFAGPDSDYDPHIAQPDIKSTDMETRKQTILEILAAEAGTPELCYALERKTEGQYGNIVWRDAKLERLTASMFMKVCKMCATISSHSITVLLLSFIPITPYGLFVDPEHSYLGANPHDVVGKEMLVKVKCLRSLSDMKQLNMSITTICKAYRIKKVALHFNNKEEIVLNKNSSCYFQIQE